MSSEVERHFSVRPPNSRMFQVATSRLRSAFFGISRESWRRRAVSSLLVAAGGAEISPARGRELSPPCQQCCASSKAAIPPGTQYLLGR